MSGSGDSEMSEVARRVLKALYTTPGLPSTVTVLLAHGFKGISDTLLSIAYLHIVKLTANVRGIC